MNSSKMIEITNDTCGEDPLSSTEIKNEPKDMIENSQQCIKQEDTSIKDEIKPHLQVVPSKSESEKFHNIQLEEKSSNNENGANFEAGYNLISSNTFYSEALIEKCNLEQQYSEPASIDKEITANKDTDIVSHKCVFSSESSFLLQNDAIVHNSIKTEFSLPKDVRVKTTFCQECNKSLNLYMCEICKRVFSDENLIENHMYSHKRSHECEICHKSFSTKHILNNHVIIHTGERPYSCELCDKSYNNSSNLVRHINLHSKERPYKCEYCNKTFFVKAGLKFHMSKHTGERPHRCDFCSKTYSRKAYLNIHLKTHTEKKSKIVKSAVGH